MASTNHRCRVRKARVRRNNVKAAIDRTMDQMAEAQDRYLAGDIGELTDFELDILGLIHGDD
jgi:hypothetical protein